MRRKIFALLTALVLCVSLVPTALAASTYTDTDGHWAEEAIERWTSYGIIQGNNGKFNPDGSLTRGQMAAILCRLLNLPEAEDAGFTDVNPDDWFADYINRCAAVGILLGDNGKANPNGTITRQQAFTMLGRALSIQAKSNPDLSNFTDGDEVSDYAKGYVAAMIEAGIVKGIGDGKIGVNSNITRAAFVTILDRAITFYVNEAGKTVKVNTTGIVLVVADNVTITGTAGSVVVAPGVTGVVVNGKQVQGGTAYDAASSDASGSSGGSGGSSSGGGSGNTPDVDNPETDKPGVDDPETDKPEADDPETDKPEADDPEADKPEADDPEECQAIA